MGGFKHQFLDAHRGRKPVRQTFLSASLGRRDEADRNVCLTALVERRFMGRYPSLLTSAPAGFMLLPLAEVDNWIGLLIFIVIVVLSGLSKMFQKGREEEPEEMPRPQPPVIPPRPVRRPLSQQEVQEVLRRMRPPMEHGVPRHKPPVIQVPEEEAPRRLVELQPEKPELPSEHPEQAPHATVIPSAHPEEAPHRTLLPSVHPEETPHIALPSALRKPIPAVTPSVVSVARATAYRQQLGRPDDVRRAIVLRELLGPPVGLREDW